MGAWNQDLPHSFKEGLRISRKILSSNHDLVGRGTIDTEAEQLVIGAYRLATGEPLSRVEFFSRLSDRLPGSAGERVLVMATARAAGQPLQYLIGHQAFLEHEYEVGPGVLVPRPETEQLAQRAIEAMKLYRPEAKLGLEIGLGSGVLSIELLHAMPKLRMVASELSPAAASYAEKNARKILGAEASRLTIIAPSTPMEVLAAFQGALGSSPAADFIISNPPYVAEHDPIDSDVLAHEPHEALFAPTGDLIFFYREIAVRGCHVLRPGGFAFVELPETRADKILELFRLEGWDAEVFADLTQRDRVLIAQLG